MRVGILADEQRLQVLDRADDAARVPFERRLAPAEEAGLVGQDLDEDPVAHPRVADVRFDGGDLHRASSRTRRCRRPSPAADPAAQDAERWSSGVGPVAAEQVEVAALVRPAARAARNSAP